MNFVQRIALLLHLVGFILGEMPEYYRKEQWRVILSVYGQLTPR